VNAAALAGPRVELDRDFGIGAELVKAEGGEKVLAHGVVILSCWGGAGVRREAHEGSRAVGEEKGHGG
jgi:hypothetical protein